VICFCNWYRFNGAKLSFIYSLKIQATAKIKRKLVTNLRYIYSGIDEKTFWNLVLVKESDHKIVAKGIILALHSDLGISLSTLKDMICHVTTHDASSSWSLPFCLWTLGHYDIQTVQQCCAISAYLVGQAYRLTTSIIYGHMYSSRPTTWLWQKLTIGWLQLNLDQFHRCRDDSLDTATNSGCKSDFWVRRCILPPSELVEYFAIDAEKQAAAHTFRRERESHASIQRPRLQQRIDRSMKHHKLFVKNSKNLLMVIMSPSAEHF